MTCSENYFEITLSAPILLTVIVIAVVNYRSRYLNSDQDNMLTTKLLTMRFMRKTFLTR